MKRLFLLVFAVLMVSGIGKMEARAYRSEWREVDRLIEADKPSSAMDKVLEIQDRAMKSGNDRQSLRCCMMLMRIESEFKENNMTLALERIDLLLPTLKKENFPLGCAVKANCLRSYYQSNKWRIRRNVRTAEMTDDYSQWDSDTFVKVINDFLYMSLTVETDATAKTRVTSLDGLLETGNREGRRVCSSLLDVLYENALWNCEDVLPVRLSTLFTKPEMFADAETFLKFAESQEALPWNINVLKHLYRFHSGKKESAEQMASIDLIRFQTIEDFYSRYMNDDRFYTGLLEVGSRYISDTDYSTLFFSKWYSGQYTHFRNVRNNTDFSEADAQEIQNATVQLYRAINAWPESEGGKECQHWLNDMKCPEISMTTWTDIAPNAPALAELKYRNAEKIYYNAYKVKADLDTWDIEPEFFDNLEPEKSWVAGTDDPGDMMTRSLAFSLPELGIGWHLVTASVSEKVQENASWCMMYVQASRLMLLRNESYGLPERGFIVDKITGKPITGCKYELWEMSTENKRNEKPRRIRLVASGETAADGSFGFIPGKIAGANYELEFSKDGDGMLLQGWESQKTYVPKSTVVHIFTDRYTYKPGEKIQFTCLAYQSDGHVAEKLKKDLDLEVWLSDVNWQEVEKLKLTTDEFGRASGEFTIPENALTGSFRIQVSTEDNTSNTKYVNVEAYKRPTFTVTMGSENRTFLIDSVAQASGKAMSLTGVPLNGAMVQYTVEERRESYYDSDVQVATGTVETGIDGSFIIEFRTDAVKGGSSSSSRHYKIEARVTDINGETHTAYCYITAGHDTPSAELITEEKYTVAPEFRTYLKNDASDMVEGKVTVKIEKLKTPEKFLLDVSGMGRWSHVPDSVAVLFQNYSYKSVRREKWPVEETVYEEVLSTPIGGDVKVKPGVLKNGTYKVTATPVLSAEVKHPEYYSEVRYFTVTLPDDSRMPDDSQLFMVPEKNSYEVGDTASFLIGSASDAPVYYVVENRLGVVKSGMLECKGSMQKLLLPVTFEMLGRITVRATTVCERVMASDYVSVSVPYTHKKLDFSFKTFRDKLEPDQSETWKLQVTDSEGNPVKAALITAMFDQALDSYGSNRWYLTPWSEVWLNTSALASYNRPSLREVTQDSDWPMYEGNVPVHPSLPGLFTFYDDKREGRIMYKTAAFGSANIQMAYAMNGDYAVEEEMVMAEPVERVATDDTRVGGLDITVSDSETHEAAPEPAPADMPFVETRTDLNPTAFFMPTLQTGEDGYVEFKFKAPQLLTKWNFQGLAYTDNVAVGTFMKNVTTRKMLMVQPGVPRFVRQGDVMEFVSKVSNLSEKETDATVRLEVLDAVTMEPVMMIGKAGSALKSQMTVKVKVPAGASAPVSFPLVIGPDARTFIYRVTAAAGKHTDGQQELVPVLYSRSAVTASVSLFNNGNETRTFKLDVLADGLLSETARDRQLTLEYTASPIWYAIQALPYLTERSDPSNERLFHRYFAGSLSQALIKANPSIGEMLEEWNRMPDDEWQTRLEQHADIKQMLLEETPWVLESASEKQNLKRLASAYADGRMETEMKDAWQKLTIAQESEGGWAWISGFTPSVYITTTIMKGLGQLIELGAENLTNVDEVAKRAVQWLDRQMREENKDTDWKKKKSLYYTELEYLLVRTYFKDVKFSAGTQDTYDRLLKIATTEPSHDLDIYGRARLALILARSGKMERARELNVTLLERSLYDDEQGRYWRDNAGGYLWHQAPVETQSLIVQALVAAPVTEEKWADAASESARWLLKQKQTTHWSSSPATAQAVVALLAAGHGSTLENPAVTQIKLGSKTFQAGGKKADAGYLLEKIDNPTKSMGNVTVKNDYPDIGWGSLSISYTDEMDKVHYSENGIGLERTLYRITNDDKGEVLEKITETDALKVGDRMRISIKMTVDRNLEYVQLKDMRPAAFEPVSTHSGYSYNFADDLASYRAPGNSANVFYMDRLSKGTYMITYDVYVEQAGTFKSGLTVAQCMYAPEFRATSSSPSITVK